MSDEQRAPALSAGSVQPVVDPARVPVGPCASHPPGVKCMACDYIDGEPDQSFDDGMPPILTGTDKMEISVKKCPNCGDVEGASCSYCRPPALSAGGRYEPLSDYAIALQRAIEHHCHDREVPEWIAKDCRHHAEMLNAHRVRAFEADARYAKLRAAAERVCGWMEQARVVLHEAVASGKAVDPDQALRLTAVWNDVDELREAIRPSKVPLRRTMAAAARPDSEEQ